MNHIKLRELIRKVDGNKNKQLKDLPLLGINIDKEFMPSVANTIGTDMSNYQIVKKEQFFMRILFNICKNVLYCAYGRQIWENLSVY